MGVDTKIAVNTQNYPSFITCYSDMPNVCGNVIEFSDEVSLVKHLEATEIVVCTIFTSVRLVKNALTKTKNKPKVAYYAQDYATPVRTTR
jgi:hypothetical protein